VKTLLEAGRQVIALDNRGHGHSQKLYDPALYEAPQMAEDSRRLLDHLGIVAADVIGYSMGARISAFLAINHPDRVRSATIGGLGANMFTGVGKSDLIADALEANSRDEVSDPTGQAFRIFAEQTKGDLRALAACMRAGRPAISREMAAEIECPVLVVAGDADDVAGPVAPLVDAIANAQGVVLAGKDHMKAVGDLTFKRKTVEFLDAR
jgi:pimeloyl-ACP methyl ester carboxylesterase